MAQEDIVKMARKAGIAKYGLGWTCWEGQLEAFAALVAAAEREKVAAWMMARGYATGHGDTIEELLQELDWQIREQEREACATVCEGLGVHPALNVFNGGPEWYKHGKDCAAAIRARGNT
jgi:hypothetical protein